MSYYGAKGDFYSGRTGYYRGDPGFFSSLGGIIKNVGGALVKSYTGVDLFGGSSPAPQPTISAAGSAGLGLMGAAGTVAGRRSTGRGRLSAAAGTMARMGGAVVRGAMGGPLVSRGTAMQAAPRMSSGRRGHRMNVCNPRALRRAIRRAKGFEKLALRSIRLVSPRRLAGKHRGGFKTTRRRK